MITNMRYGCLILIVLLLRPTSIVSRLLLSTIGNDDASNHSPHHRHNRRRTASQTQLFDQFLKWVDHFRYMNRVPKVPRTRSPIVTPPKPPTLPKPSPYPITITTSSPSSSKQIKPSGSDVKCGCKTCTDIVWNTLVDESTCGSKIFYLLATQPTLYPTDEVACHQVGGIEFPNICSACDPNACHNDPNNAPSPSSSTTSSYPCGCETCTKDILKRKADGHTCEARINWVQLYDHSVMGSELASCALVSKQFNAICGPECDPHQCRVSSPPPMTKAPVPPPITSAPVPPPMIQPLLPPPTTQAPIASPPITQAPVSLPITTKSPISTISPVSSPNQNSIPSIPTMIITCGCALCTNDVLNQIADEYTCGDRIRWVIQNDPVANGLEELACRIVAKQFPTICGGPRCDPDICSDYTSPISPTLASPTTVIPITPTMKGNKCGCVTCTEDVLNQMADGYTCGDRITWEIEKDPNTNGSEAQACRIVSGQFSSICGSCNPDSCSSTITPPSSPSSPTSSSSSPTKSPTVISHQHVVPSTPVMKLNCGCATCTDTILSRIADGYTCGARIRWLIDNDPNANQSEIQACRIIAEQYPTICGGTACHPDICTSSPTPPPDVGNHPPALPPVVSNLATMSLYCYPPLANRQRFTNVWGNHIMEVKENDGVCGPGDNMFSRQTVSFDSEQQELTLQFKMINGVWTGSEIRLFLPPDVEPFTYGTFQFSVKSVSYQRNNVEIMQDLPPSLVLGLFTWDPTDDYATHANWNHEVDVEISRWNDTSDMDAQFLVQPPGEPQLYRFYTGSNNGRSPGNNRYQFLWNPGEITWYSTAGGGQYHTYSVKQAIDAGVDDFVQCLPAHVEIRMNLWNMLGLQTPTDMATTDMVEVIIDNFVHSPSGLVGVPNGGYCTKDCQCQPPLICFSRQCLPA